MLAEARVAQRGARLAQFGTRESHIQIAGQRPLNQGLEFGIMKVLPPLGQGREIFGDAFKRILPFRVGRWTFGVELSLLDAH